MLSQSLHYKKRKEKKTQPHVYQAAANAIVPGGDENREASKARIPRSDKGTRSSAEAEEDASAATMLTIAWTGTPGHATRANSMSAYGDIRPRKQHHDFNPTQARTREHRTPSLKISRPHHQFTFPLYLLRSHGRLAWP